MIKKLTIITIIALAFFTGLSLGSDLSPSQDCIEWKEYFSDHWSKTSNALELCHTLNGQIMRKFYAYEDGLWKLKLEFKQAQTLIDLRDEIKKRMEESKKGDMEI